MTAEPVAPTVPAPADRSATATGTALGLVAELMMLTGLAAAYLGLRGEARGPWPPEGADLAGAAAGVLTVVLALSWMGAEVAGRAERAGDSGAARRRWRISAVLAGVFVAGGAWTWATAELGPASTGYPLAFRALTGVVGAHAVLGAALLGGRALRPAGALAPLLVNYHWRFVAGAWAGLYSLLFLWP